MAVIDRSTLNGLSQADFRDALGFVFEHSPWIAEAAWSARPFSSVDALHQAMCQVVVQASEQQQVDLIAAHPDLAGKAAIAGELTAESTREQASAGLDRLSPEQFERFTQLNTSYRNTFGFPFVICVREHTQNSILDQFETRLKHSRQQEIATALGEIYKIARLRLADAVVDA